MPLRYRLWLLFAPLLLLLAVLGGILIVSLGVVGNRIDAILRENYLSVDAMTGLNEAAEGINASFEAGLAGQPGARRHFDDRWKDYRRHYDTERHNITEPGEADLVARLGVLTDRYESLGRRFFDPARTPSERHRDAAPLHEAYAAIRQVSAQIRRLNQDSMEAASTHARTAAETIRLWAVLGLVGALLATAQLAWRAGRAILRPVEDLTRSAEAVGLGQFDQQVSAETRGEVGELVQAFNHMTAQLRDLRQTQAARLVRAQQASQATLDAFPEPVFVVDPEGRIDMANPAAREVFGVVPGHANVWEPPERLRDPLAAAFRDHQPLLTQSFDQAILYRVHGDERAYIPQLLPVRDPYGHTLGVAIVLNDVTRFRLLDEFKTDLVATASHELKTPLAGLRLAVHLLLEETVGELNDKQLELLIDARDNTERLVRIVDHLLSLARLETGHETLHPATIAAAELIQAAVDRVGPMLSGRRLSVTVEPEVPPVAVDAERFGHAIDNLLVNAATYTRDKGAITVTVRVVEDGEVEIAIADDGVGIAPEHLPHVFEKFFRIPGQSRGQGTGLGLAIVREIVTAHGGRITCESQRELGTTFRITLPVGSGP